MAPKAKRSSEDLQREMSGLVAAEARCKADIRRLRQSEATCSRTSCKYTGFQKDIALTIFLLENWSVGPAAAFLQSLRQSHCDVEALVENLALTRPVEELNAMIDRGAAKPSVYSRAKSFCIGWRLTRWVEEQNAVHGVAPPTGDVLRRRDAIESEIDGHAEQFRADTSLSRNREWCKWWRQKHGVKLGHPVVDEGLTQQEKVDKAAVLARRVGVILGPQGGPENGAALIKLKTGGVVFGAAGRAWNQGRYFY
jgi:hypothetical protein